MNGSGRLDPKFGPFTNLWQAYSVGLDTLAKGYEPALKGLGRLNLEAMVLTMRRAQAWLEIPGRIAACKTPQDLASEQLRFWQTASAHYAEGSQRLIAAAFAAAAGGPAVDGAATREARDYIAFPDAKEASAPERRAA